MDLLEEEVRSPYINSVFAVNVRSCVLVSRMLVDFPFYAKDYRSEILFYGVVGEFWSEVVVGDCPAVTYYVRTEKKSLVL